MHDRTKFSHSGVYDWLDDYYCNAKLYQRLNFYGKHSCLFCHLYVSVLRNLRKATVFLFFFSGKFDVCVHGVDNCMEMFPIIAIYDDERVINISEPQSWSILCHDFGSNARPRILLGSLYL